MFKPRQFFEVRVYRSSRKAKGTREQQLEMMPSRKSMSEKKLQLGLKNLNS